MKLTEQERQKIEERERLRGLEEERKTGKSIFENEMIYNPETKLFRYNEHDSWREAPYSTIKYMKEVCDVPCALKNAEQFYLYEGLQMSWSIETLLSKLRLFEELELINALDAENPMQWMNPDKTPTVTFFVGKNAYESCDKILKKYYSEMLRIIKVAGYFIARKTNKTEKDLEGNDVDVVWFQLHPKFIVEVTDRIYNNTDGILYHLTMKRNLPKIQKYGFIPRNSGRFGDNYPDRVYLFTFFPPDNFKGHVKNFAKVAKDDYRKKLESARAASEAGKIPREKYDYLVAHRYDYRDWVIIHVNLKDKRSYIEGDDTTRYRFFDDPKCPGVFTYENIDPLCLTIGQEVKYKDTDDFEEFVIKD